MFVYIFHRFSPHFPLHFARSHPLVSTPTHDNRSHLSPQKFVRSLTNTIVFLLHGSLSRQSLAWFSANFRPSSPTKIRDKGGWGKQIGQQRVRRLRREGIERREKKHRRHGWRRHEPCTREKKLVKLSAVWASEEDMNHARTKRNWLNDQLPDRQKETWTMHARNADNKEKRMRKSHDLFCVLLCIVCDNLYLCRK